MAKLYIGTCGWKYESWRKLVYTESSEINYLKEYSDLYNTVIIDKWFFSLYGNNKVVLPKLETVTGYKNSVNKDFKFSVNIPNSITLTHLNSHDKEELIPNSYFLSADLMKEFLGVLKPLKWNLGVLLFQFEYLNKHKIKSQYELQGLLREFISLLPGNIHFAVEIRNSSFLNEEYFQFMRDNKMGICFLQGYDMPDIFDLHKRYKDYIKDYCVIHLYGEDRKGIETKSGGEWNKIISPKDEELIRLVEMINELHERSVDIYLYVHNYYEGSAPLTIVKIQNLMKEVSH